MANGSNSKVRHMLGQWQRRWQKSQTGNILARLLAWIILGIAMLMSLFLLIFLLMISWLLIPVMIYRARRRAAAMQSGFNSQQAQKRAHVIEGELVHKEDADRDANRGKY